MIGLLFAACAMLGIREPLDFFDLSPFAQQGWLAHARNTMCNRYLYGPPADEVKADKLRGWVEAARARGSLPPEEDG